MAAAVAQEGALQDDFLIWRYAGDRARQAADAARARAEAAAEQDRSEQRRGLRGLTPALERAVRGLSLRRRAVGAPTPPVAIVKPATPAPRPVPVAPRPVAIVRPATPAPKPVAVATPLTVVAPVKPAVPLARPYAEDDSPATPLDDILSRGVTVPLRVAFLMYDDVLEALQRLHASGATHGGVDPAAIAVDMEGRCSLRPAHRGAPGIITATSPMADVNAATAVLVEALAGLRTTDRSSPGGGSPHPTPLLLNALPLPARRLVEETLASQAALRTPGAAKLRADLSVTASAFLGDDWEPGARAWLAAAAYARCAAQREEEAAARAAAEGKRPLLFGGVKRRESRILIGLGVAAGASVTLVAGAAVAMSGSRADIPQPATRASIVAPAPSVVPSLSPSSPAAAAPSAAPTAATTPPPQPAAPQVATRPAANPPATFAPVSVPTLPPTLAPAPSPTPSQCLLGILC